MTDKIILGLTEPVKLVGSDGKEKEVRARIDTGATKSSIDNRLASELHLGPIIKTKLVKSAQGTDIRPVIRAKIVLAGREIESEFTLANRTHLKYPVLIGQNLLKDGFMIDPSKK